MPIFHFKFPLQSLECLETYEHDLFVEANEPLGKTQLMDLLQRLHENDKKSYDYGESWLEAYYLLLLNMQDTGYRVCTGMFAVMEVHTAVGPRFITVQRIFVHKLEKLADINSIDDKE